MHRSHDLPSARALARASTAATATANVALRVSLRMSLWVTIPVFLASCTDDPARTPPGPPVAVNPFPVRILPPRPAVDPDLVEKETFEEGPGEWWALGVSGKRISLERVQDSDLAYVEEGALVMPRGQTTLVRFVDLPPGHQHDLNVILQAGDEAVVGEYSDLLHSSILQELDPGADVEEILRSQVIRAGDRSIPFRVALPIKLRFQQQRPQARWQSAPDLGGFARVRHRIIGTNTRRLYAIFLPATDGEVRLRSFDIRQVARFRSQNSISRSKDGATLVKLSGEVRPAVWIDPEETLLLPTSLPEGSRHLELALAADPDSTAQTRCHCAITLATSDGATLARWSQEIVREKGAPHFLPVTIPLDATGLDKPGDISATLRVEIEGDMGLFLAQPMIRGAARDRRKNLLFISLDTLRADHLGSYGYERDTSPFLDDLAGKSARFQNYFSVAPYTLPTHATMFSGRLPIRHGAISETDRLDTREVPYLPRILGDYGYVSAAFTGGGFLSEVFGFPDGFDQFRTDDPIKPEPDSPDGDPLDQTHAMRDVISWIEGHRDERWFVFLHSFMIHDYKPPAEDLALFDTHPEVTEGRDHFVYMRDREWVDDPPSPGDVEHYVDRYDATIHYTDRILAAFFRSLERAGILDDTIVVVTADHGEEFWDHGSLKHSVTLYDEMLRVPLWIHVPGAAPEVITELTSQADLMPTLLDLLDIDQELDLDGHSFASFVRGAPVPPTEHTPLHASVDTRLGSRAALRIGAYKIIENHRSKHVRVVAREASELYDGRSDPAESRDLGREDASRTARMLEQLHAVEAMLRMGAVNSLHAEMTPELMDQLRELGYLGKVP